MPPAADRPEKRILVRWSDDLDKAVLLAIQYACNESGVRIPFDRVAELMGPKFSNGAIVQHLAKLRAKMVEADLEDVPIPPPLKKGMTTKEPSKIYAPGNKRKKPAAAAGAIGAAAGRAPATPPARKTTKAKGKKIKKEASDDESEEEPDLYDSDEEWGVSKKKAKKLKKSPVKKERLSDSEVSPKTVKADSEGEDVKDGEKEDSPGMSTRGRRLNYAQMENGAGEEEVDGEEDGDVEYEEAQDDVVTTPAQVPPEDDGFNGLPTPEGQVETAVAPFTLVRPTALAAPPPIQNLRYSYDTPSAPAQRRYPAAPSNGLDFISGGGSQHYPTHYNYNSFNNQLGSPFSLATYAGQNWSFDGNPYGMQTQTRPTTGNHNPRGSMSAPQTPARRQSMAMAVSYDTPPYTRNNSTVTLDSNSNSSIANSFSASTPSQSQAQHYAAITATAGVPTTGVSSSGVSMSAPITQTSNQSQATASTGPSFDSMNDLFAPGYNFHDDDDFKEFTNVGFGGDGDAA